MIRDRRDVMKGASYIGIAILLVFCSVGIKAFGFGFAAFDIYTTLNR